MRFVYLSGRSSGANLNDLFRSAFDGNNNNVIIIAVLTYNKSASSRSLSHLVGLPLIIRIGLAEGIVSNAIECNQTNGTMIVFADPNRRHCRRLVCCVVVVDLFPIYKGRANESARRIGRPN